MKLVALIIATAVASAGCAKRTRVTAPDGPPAEGAQYQAPPDEDAWNEAWGFVAERGQELAKAGEWTLETTKDGAVMVWRGTKRVAGATAEFVSDAALHTAVRSRLAANPRVDSDEIDLDVDEGAVVLRGTLSSSDEASEAVRTTLSTRGVDTVVSHLKWPRP
ncbi:MAG: BON domain-containing protein [Deltaproteobacteria bacterium]|nr:BON domain-containing protein [Deltaproteobacteria bacterium]